MTTDDIMPSPNQTEKETNHLFFNLIELDPEDEEDSIFMSVLNDITSKCGIGTIDLLPREDLHSTRLNLPDCLAVEVKSLQHYLKHFQEKLLFSIDTSFD